MSDLISRQAAIDATIAVNDIDFLEITDGIDTIMCIDRDLSGR